MAKNFVGKQFTIKAGTRVTRAGKTYARKLPSVVTILSQEPARNGKIKLSWKSHGVKATTLVG